MDWEKNYLEQTKCLILNLQLLPFMAYKDAKIYYKLIKDEFSDNDEKLAEFYENFENTWFSLTNPDSTRYSFSLWSYSGKFNFQGNKKILISQNNLKEYIILPIILLNHLIIYLMNVYQKI